MPPRNAKNSADEISTFDQTYNKGTTDFLDNFQSQLGNDPSQCEIQIIIKNGLKSRNFVFKGIHDQGFMDSIYSRFKDAHYNKGSEIQNLMGNAGIENDPNA
jgi:hypothetical protein